MYLDSHEGQVVLAVVAAVSSQVADPTVAATFGKYRTDALYLIPVNRGSQPTELLMDFRRNRERFRLSVLEAARPAALNHLPMRRVNLIRPTAGAIAEFVRREFPALAEVL